MSSTSGTRGALSVVLFSGGRGSGALTRQLVARPGVSLTVAINGYDDGASTGEVRRFLGDSLGPSDFRKNASRLALELKSANPALVELLDARLPDTMRRCARLGIRLQVLRSRASGSIWTMASAGVCRRSQSNPCCSSAVTVTVHGPLGDCAKLVMSCAL